MSCCVRPDRGDPSAVTADAFRNTASRMPTAENSKRVVLHDHKATDSIGSKPARRIGFDDMAGSSQQDKIASDFELPTGLPEVRDSKSAGSEDPAQYTLPQQLDLASLRQMPTDILEKLLSFSVNRQTADNLYFIFSAQHLLASTGSERTQLASKMQRAFTNQDAPLALNLTGKNQKAVQLVLSDLASGRVPTNLDQVLTQACNNLLQSFSSDVYRPFLQQQTLMNKA